MSAIEMGKDGLPKHGIACFGADMKCKTFVCDGCQGEDVTVWEKEGLEHWRNARKGETSHKSNGFDTGSVVCGHYRLKVIPKPTAGCKWRSRRGDKIMTPLSYLGDYTISHRPRDFTLSFRPTGEHHHVGSYPSLARAKAAAVSHAAT